MSTDKTTTVINLFGGPGAGKTTCAWEIAAALKKKGFVTEYVSEYAKELVWNGEHEKLNGTIENQKKLYEEQKHRVHRLLGKVDFVVTDSPTLLSLIYLQEPNPEFEKEISRDFKGNNNFCLIIQRGKVFEAAGRIHTLEQSKQIDAQIQQLLVNENIPFGVYHHQSIDKAIENMIRVHWGRKQEHSAGVPEQASFSNLIEDASARASASQTSLREKTTAPEPEI